MTTHHRPSTTLPAALPPGPDTSTPAPLVALDATGVPTPLSYDVPEPMAYSGRNFVTIALPSDAFIVQAQDPAHVLAVTVASLAAAPGPGPAPAPLTVGHGVSLAGPPRVAGVGKEPPDPPELPDPPRVSVFVDSPPAGFTAHGTSKGVTLQVCGRWVGSGFVGSPAVTLTVDAGAPSTTAVTGTGSWSAPVTLTEAGQHSLTVTAAAVGSTYRGAPLTARDTARITIDVSLTADPKPPPSLPTIVLDQPRARQVVSAPSGQAPLGVSGTVTVDPASPLTVVVTDTATGNHQQVMVGSGRGPFSVTLPVLGLGTHDLSVVATSAAGGTSSVSLPVSLSLRPPRARIANRLMIVETLNLTSYLGAYGAGRLLKTFSLLAGEKTTISLKTYRNDVETAKQAVSILDSAASEAASDFEDAVSQEQTDKDSAAQSSAFKIGAKASASWGFGNASIDASYSGAANSAREEAVKNVSTATRKHALKASTNRSVTVNTETASTLTTTQDDSTIREIANINVARTLNYVFRQMNQEHIVLYHLTDARIGYYAEDIPLDGDGKALRDEHGNVVVETSYQEVTLPELSSLLGQVVQPGYAPKVRDAIVNALSCIPDHEDQLRSLVEVTTPVDATGSPVASAAYLRVVRNLNSVYEDAYSPFTIRVPGILLASDHIVQRTDGVFVEAVLGQGDALDPYSHGLQDAAVGSRAAAVAQSALAAGLVATHDAPGADIYQKVFLMPPAADRPAPAAGATSPPPSR